jgi:uncharacterized protein YraI
MMMKTLLATFAILPAMLMSGQAMAAADGFTTGDVNMRAGPGTHFPRITVLPEGSDVRIYGCLRNRSWCDVAAYRVRGWVHSRYLSIFYSGGGYQPYHPVIRPPVVTFSFGYWDDWYRDRPFYYKRPHYGSNDRPVGGPLNDDRPYSGSAGDDNDVVCVPSPQNYYCDDPGANGGMIPEGGSVNGAVQGGFND